MVLLHSSAKSRLLETKIEKFWAKNRKSLATRPSDPNLTQKSHRAKAVCGVFDNILPLTTHSTPLTKIFQGIIIAFSYFIRHFTIMSKKT